MPKLTYFLRLDQFYGGRSEQNDNRSKEVCIQVDRWDLPRVGAGRRGGHRHGQLQSALRTKWQSVEGLGPDGEGMGARKVENLPSSRSTVPGANGSSKAGRLPVLAHSMSEFLVILDWQ